MNRFDLIKRCIEAATGRPLESMRPEPLRGRAAVEALWSLNDRFRPVIARIRSVGYDGAFETEADDAIAGFALGTRQDWSALSVGAWRVLLERQQQGIAVALAVAGTGTAVMSIPAGLSAAQRKLVVVLYMLHGMKLPHPPADRSGFELPAGSARASLRLH